MLFSNCSVDAVSVTPTYRKPFDMIFERARSAKWSGREDSNLRPPGPEPGALPDCATPRTCCQEPLAMPSTKRFAAKCQKPRLSGCRCVGGNPWAMGGALDCSTDYSSLAEIRCGVCGIAATRGWRRCRWEWEEDILREMMNLRQN